MENNENEIVGAIRILFNSEIPFLTQQDFIESKKQRQKERMEFRKEIGLGPIMKDESVEEISAKDN